MRTRPNVAALSGATAVLSLALSFAACQLVGGIDEITLGGGDALDAGESFDVATGPADEGGLDGSADARSSTDAAPGQGDSSSHNDSSADIDATVDAAPPSAPSCTGIDWICANTLDCCARNPVRGGTFYRSNDGSQPATVSDFKLDLFEVTVGRFRNFVNDGSGTRSKPPAAGAGAHPAIANSGWTATMTSKLAFDTAEFVSELKCDANLATWSDTPNGSETLPINCVDFYEAFAFCAWDGGRLPTEAEWNFAAAAGSAQRVYPWGATASPSNACYDCACDGSPTKSGAGSGQCARSDILPVGSFPAGAGKWGQRDLSGSVWEWTLDFYATPYPSPCTDCANLGSGSNRVLRGGSFTSIPSDGMTTVRNASGVPAIRFPDTGFRCARD